MSSPFDVYKATYHDQSVTDRDGNILKKRDHEEDDHQEILTTAAVVPEEFIEPRDVPKMIKGH